MWVGADDVRQDMCVPAIILAASGREAVTEAVQLLGIDGVDLESAIQQAVHDRPVGSLDGDADLVGVAANAAQDPVDQLAGALARVLKVILSEGDAVGIEDADLV